MENLVGAYTTGISSLQSFNRLKNLLGVSLDTVERHSRYLELARLFVFIKKFGYSALEQIRSVRKVYIIDTDYVQGFRFSHNMGKLMENVVAIELLRIVLKEGQTIRQLIQVTYSSGRDDIERREIEGLIKASKELKCSDLLVITWDYEMRRKRR